MRTTDNRGRILFGDYQDAIKDLKKWQEDDVEGYYSHLYNLFTIAPAEDFEKLSIVYPVEAKAYTDWDNSDAPEEFIENILAYTEHPLHEVH